jgi:calcineurin-binding protein cabin-1
VGSSSCLLSLLLPSDRSQDSTAVALSDSSSTQDFFNEPTSSLEGSRKPFAEKRLPVLSAQTGLTGKDLQGATEERGMKISVN